MQAYKKLHSYHFDTISKLIDMNSELEIESLFKKYLIDGKIKMNELSDIQYMIKRLKQAKAMHNYEIHHTDKSGWFTVVDDDTQPSGKRKIGSFRT